MAGSSNGAVVAAAKRSAGALAGAVVLTLVPGAGHAQQCDLYKRLITAHDGVYVNSTVMTTDVCGRVSLNGVILEAVNDNTNCAISEAPYGLVVETQTCPVPDVAGFLSAHWSDGLDVSAASTSTFNLVNPGGGAAFFRTLADPDKTGFSVYIGDSDPAPTINVTGTVIWLLDHGLKTTQLLRVTGTTNDCLVIVSGTNRDPLLPAFQNVGIWCAGGIQSPNVPVIFVTDGEVRAEHANNLTGAQAYSLMPYVSLFASHAFLGGPSAPNYMRLYHDPSSPYDAPGGLIDALCLHGLLPNVEGPPVERAPSTWGRLKTIYR